jgi:hypothetical protein
MKIPKRDTFSFKDEETKENFNGVSISKLVQTPQ